MLVEGAPQATLEADGEGGHASIVWFADLESARIQDAEQRRAGGAQVSWSAIWPGFRVKTPAAIMLVMGVIQDWSRYRLYLAGVRDSGILARFGATPIFHGPPLDVPSGVYGADQVTVAIRFPSMAAIRTFWSSEDYASIRRLRDGAARLNVSVWLNSHP